MKIKNPWHRPKIIFIAAFIAVGIIIMVAIAVVQNKPLLQKYKVWKQEWSSEFICGIHLQDVSYFNNTDKIHRTYLLHVYLPNHMHKDIFTIYIYYNLPNADTVYNQDWFSL